MTAILLWSVLGAPTEPPAAWSDRRPAEPPAAWSRTPAASQPPGRVPAVERYVLVNGVVYRTTDAAPGVAAPPPFRGGYHPGHNCPACGTPEYRVAGRNADGTHVHVCPRCGTSWRH